jgi:hypothetical protein
MHLRPHQAPLVRLKDLVLVRLPQGVLKARQSPQLQLNTKFLQDSCILQEHVKQLKDGCDGILV